MEMPFNLEIEGRDAGHSASMSITNSTLSREFAPQNGGFFHEELQLFVKEEGNRLTIENRSSRAVTVRHFSRFFSLPLGGVDSSRLRLHWLDSSWEGEFQYRTATLRELNVYPVSVHPIAKSFSILSHGTYTTCTHVPFLVLENEESGETIWCSAAFAGSWRIEAGLRGDTAYLDATEIDARHCGTEAVLPAGDSFYGVPIFGGIVHGGFEEACHAHYKTLRSVAGDRSSPVVFNDYMNCLWARPNDKKLLPLIEAAAEAGAEVFCIDDGWYLANEEERTGRMGDWRYSRTLFGEVGFPGIIKAIQARGMKAGIWLEMEVCGEKSELYQKPDSWFLCRGGVRIGGEDRVFLDFRNPEVCDYLRGIVKFYYDLGIRYIKNDYNACVDGWGYEVTEHARAVREFYRSLKEEFSDLLLENCGSGAMRCDEGLLAICDVQSTSDQESAENYPSIAVGALAYMPPELACMWAYPYPHLFMEYFTHKPFDETKHSAESVVYNLVTGLAGTPCLSGRIDRMNEEAGALVKEAVSLHKQLRSFKSRALPYFPLGLALIGEKKKTQALVLRDGDEGLLYVWSYGEAVLPLSLSEAKQIYPSHGFESKIALRREDTVIDLPQTFCARLYRVQFGKKE